MGIKQSNGKLYMELDSPELLEFTIGVLWSAIESACDDLNQAAGTIHGEFSGVLGHSDPEDYVNAAIMEAIRGRR